MATYACPVCGLTAEFDPAMPEGYACPRCMCPGERFKMAAGEEITRAEVKTADPAGEEAVSDVAPVAPDVEGEHPVPAGLPSGIEADVRAAVERAQGQAGSLLASAQAARGAGCPEAADLLEHAAHEAARHAARLSELLGGQGAACAESLLASCGDLALAESERALGLAGRAQAADAPALQAALSEVACDQERLAQACAALSGRLFG